MKFIKMHSLGNDFVIFAGFEQKISISRKQARKIAHRNFGIGCDQILLVNEGNNEGNFFEFQIFNQDGSKSDQCGNGARCVARYLHDLGYSKNNEIVLKTSKDEMVCTVNQTFVSVKIGVPRFEPTEIPLIADSKQDIYSIDVNGSPVELFALSLGNPHAVITVPDVDKANVESIGSYVESCSRFPQRTNVGFMEIESEDSIRLRVFERGVGETYACGSGASAATVAGRCQGRLNEDVKVNIVNGQLNVRWKGEGHPVILSGPTSYVFRGKILTNLA